MTTLTTTSEQTPSPAPRTLCEVIKVIKDMLLFSWPIIIGQIGQMLFGLGDIMVAGRYSKDALAAVGLASAMFAPFLLVGMGTMMALAPLISQSLGAKLENRRLLPNGIIVAIITTLISTILAIILYYNFHLFKLDPHLENLTKQCFVILIPSILPAMIYQAFKETLQAYHYTMFANSLILALNVVNIFLNIIFMWGLGPIPELGVQGAALATLTSRFLMASFIIIYAFKKLEFEWSCEPTLIKNIFKLGIPISLGNFVEIMVFSTVTVLVGKMSILAGASHNIALNYSGLTFMVPLALGSAAAVKVGHAYGAKNIELIKLTSIAVLVLTISCMFITALHFWFIPEILLGISTNDHEIIEYGKRLLFYVAIFQLPDGLQVALWGILRGLGVTKIPMILSFVANWLIGFPIGLYFAFTKGMEASGLWLGLTVGLVAICSSLLFLLRYQLKKIKKEIQKTPLNQNFIPIIN